MAYVITVNGLEELNNVLDKLKNYDAEKALNKACILVENEAKRNVTNNGTVKTGELRNSITHKVDNGVGEVYTNLTYAPYVEYGTGVWSSQHNGRTDVPWVYYVPGGYWYEDPRTGERKLSFWCSTIGQKPHPYLIPALNNNRTKVVSIIRDDIEEVLNNGRLQENNTINS